MKWMQNLGVTKKEEKNQILKYFHLRISTNTQRYYLQGCNNRRLFCPEADKLNIFFIYLFIYGFKCSAVR